MLQNKKVKICALTTVSLTMNMFMSHSMRYLSENGYDVTLVCNIEEDAFVEQNSDFAKCIDLKMSRGASLKELLVCTWKLYKLFRKEKFDVIYYATPNVSLYASLAGALAGVKCRNYCQWGIRYVSFEGIKRKMFKLVEKTTCTFSKTIRSASPLNMEFSINEKLCKREKISVIGIGGTVGVELDKCNSFDKAEANLEMRQKYNIPESAFVYGFVGRINVDKGLNELISAFKKVSKADEKPYLVLVGALDTANPISEENLRFAKESDRVVLTGRVPADTVYKHMAMFNVLVHPSYREGFGKVLQEAMGVKTPIITTNIPGPSEVIENNVSGILCEAKNADDLAEKMLMLYNDPALCESFAEAGYKRATTYFDRPIMLKNILDDINKTVGI